MNITKSFKFHYYTYFKMYLAFWLSLWFATLVLLLITKNNHYEYLILSIIILTSIFSFAIGIYEYNRLAFHYINLNTLKKEFFYGSIVYSIIHGFIQVIMTLFLFLIINYIYEKESIVYDFPFTFFSIYLFTFLLHIALFILANTLTLLLRKVKYIKNIVFIFILAFLSLYFFDLIEFLKTNLLAIYYNSQIVYQLIPVFISLIIMLNMGNYLLFIHKKNNLYQN